MVIRRTWTIENTWVCDSCGTKCKGRDIKCSQCGSSKEKAEKDQINADAPAVVEAPLLALAAQAPHWECEYCGSKQRAPDGNCASCGGAKARAGIKQKIDLPAVGEPPLLPAGVVYSVGEPRAFIGTSPTFTPARSPMWEPSAVPVLKKKSWLGIGVTLVLFVGVITALFWPWEVDAVVASTSWIHTTTLEQRSTEHDEGWDQNQPDGAFNTSCMTRQHGSHKCNPYDCNPHKASYKCNPHDCNCQNKCKDKGNGFSSCSQVCSTCYDTCYRTETDTCYRSCPTYDEWCSYDYYRWTPTANKSATGEDAVGATWPTYSESKDELHREQRQAIYQVRFRSKDEAFEYKPKDLSDFGRFHKGEGWILRVSVGGSASPIQPR